MKKLPLILSTIALLPACTTLSVTYIERKEELKTMYNEAKLETDSSPWNIMNLFNPTDDSLFLPYQLWTGMDWNGNKNSPCMHEANSLFAVNGMSETTITGPHNWKGMKVWYREKINGSKKQHFVCNSKGIGRVYDSRYPDREYAIGRCKFPAGYGWRVGVERECTATSIRITRVTFDSNYNLEAITFEWRTNGYHDHTYVYEKDYGMREAWKQ